MSKKNQKNYYIVVCGPLASGKTTLAKKIGKTFGWDVVLEDVSKNVYFSDFYKDNRRWAFHTLIAFFIRAIELQPVIHQSLNTNSICQDWYVGEHHGVYSHNTLVQNLFDQRDFDICARMNSILMQQSVVPDLAIYLHAKPETLLQRVNDRQRDGEAGSLALGYISSLVQLHEKWITSVSIPTLCIDTDAVNFESPEQLRAVINSIKEQLKIIEAENV